MPVLVPLITFTATVLLHTHLTTAQVFTTLALLNTLIFPMNALPWVVNGLIEARVSAKRIAHVLISSSLPEGAWDFVSNRFYPISHNLGYLTQTNSILCVRLRGVIFSYSSQSQFLESKSKSTIKDAIPFQIGPITMEFHKNNLYVVSGPVGSGKSLFLLGLLRETVLVAGECILFTIPSQRSESKTANHETQYRQYRGSDNYFSYCSQQPTFHSGSIRDCILSGLSFNQNR
jgi:ABC-type multidrug transport system fused ATPase/permease subunit